jgi:hypothetical protein
VLAPASGTAAGMKASSLPVFGARLSVVGAVSTPPHIDSIILIHALALSSSSFDCPAACSGRHGDSTECHDVARIDSPSSVRQPLGASEVRSLRRSPRFSPFLDTSKGYRSSTRPHLAPNIVSRRAKRAPPQQYKHRVVTVIRATSDNPESVLYNQPEGHV